LGRVAGLTFAAPAPIKSTRPFCACLGEPDFNALAQANGDKDKVGLSGQLGTDYAKEAMDARRHPRYRLETEICIYPRNMPVVRGHTVDISESGISAMLRIEVPVGEVVRLELKLPLGEVNVHALVRQRSAFRYGFQFIEDSSAQEVIGRTCRQLALEQSLANDIL
jgi:PilZ domain-containing protein